MFCLQPRSSIKFLMIAILIIKIQETIGVTVGNGNVFTGEVRNRMPIGNGTFTKANGEKFTGYFEDGKMSSKFVVEYARGYVYKGNVDEEGIKEGKGVYTWPSGSKYEGEWRSSDMHGQGIFYWANGDKYDGEWKNNQRTVQGIYYYAGGDKYVGDFRDGIFHGKGIFTWGPESSRAGDKYEGEWRNDSRTGHGIYYYASGSKYEGEINQGKRNGWGTYIFTTKGNFAEYDGEWINDDRTGYGKMVYTDEIIYNGQWNSEQKREGEGLLLWPNETCFYGQMKNNEIYHGMTMTPDLIFSFPPYKNVTFNTKGFKVVNFTTGDIECFHEDKSMSCYNQPNSTYTMHFSGPDHYYVGDTITVRRRKIMDGFGEYGLNGGFYIGEMKQGIQTGFGFKSEPFLPTLIGTFEDGKLEGLGASISYSAKHRVVYFGGYKNGKPDGPGIFIYPDGEKVVGFFNKGKLDHTKKPIYIHADRTRGSLVKVNP